jgi:hypothetical protein
MSHHDRAKRGTNPFYSTLQRAEMDAQANTDGENSSVNGEREGTPLSAMDIVHDSDEA